jgi:hypothetical protein
MISSGSKSRLERKKEEEVKRKIMWEAGSKSRELTCESCVSLEDCSPGVACPCPWPCGFFLWRRGRR